MSIAYIALGSNLGLREKNIAEAIARMQAYGLEILAMATCLETAPYGVVDQPNFLNSAVKIATVLPAEQLLATLLGIEQEMGRVRKRHWGERNIDLDLLLYDQMVINTEKLVLPHPELQNRSFVLEPLAEIAGAVIHPVFQITISELLHNLINGDDD
ncbi:MAG: 2-amino-4-hydroxy-6-hydroxymethyldihydropteridine diphosphokinase [Acidaminococcaceae bacterium]